MTFSALPVALIVALLVVAMLIGPILVARPSRRDVRLAALRDRARQLGLEVQLVVEPSGTAASSGIKAAYQKPWPMPKRRAFAGPTWQLARQRFVHEVHFSGIWHWTGAAAPASMHAVLRAAVQTLPEGVTRVESTPLGLRCLWDESGGEPTLTQISAWLHNTAEQLLPFMNA